MARSPFYNAHHSPVGAFATLTLGATGARGGFGLELGAPANENLYIGFERDAEPGVIDALPFYDRAEADTSNFDSEFQHRHRENEWRFEAVSTAQRDLTAQVDSWQFGDMTVRIYTPAWELSDPPEEHQVLPAVYIDLTLDNMLGERERKWVFGFSNSHRAAGMRTYRDHELNGVMRGRDLMISTDDPEAWSAVCFDPRDAIEPEHRENLNSMLGELGVLVGRVGPQEARRVRIVVGFYREGIATSGIETRYHYLRHFKSLEEVTLSGFDHFERAVEACVEPPNDLTPDQAWMRAMAIRSYYGSTQLLETTDDPKARKLFWNVNEGEYRMMNTLDLTVDQAFYELRKNAWTTRNVLDLFAERYGYWDDVQVGEHRESGGISFAHDMGVMNQFSDPGRSSYERAGLTGCFSYMSYEELTNWVLSAAIVGISQPNWLFKHANLLRDALTSLQFRDAEHPEDRKGFMRRDGARCKGGAEITTYDSLDASLGQARANAYLAGKAFGTFLALRECFRVLGNEDLATQADAEAARTAAALEEYGTSGRIPALLGEPSDSWIIPVIEGLAYPLHLGLKNELETCFGGLLSLMKRHFDTVLQPGICKFADGGWKLSSTSDNSWLSKIYLCQWVARELWNTADPQADSAHVEWLLRDGYWCWSDQIVAGRVQGSKYYPRGVTSELWLTRSSQSE
jgi:xylan 1,4-beta-xylosidase